MQMTKLPDVGPGDDRAGLLPNRLFQRFEDLYHIGRHINALFGLGVYPVAPLESC